jgi:hypothetical protein
MRRVKKLENENFILKAKEKRLMFDVCSGVAMTYLTVVCFPLIK